MTQKLMLAIAVPFDAATITSTATIASTLPLSNLQLQQPGDVLRFQNGDDAHLVIDLGDSSRAVNFAGAFGIKNSESADFWRIRGATSEGDLTAAPAYDSEGSGSPSIITPIWPKTGLEDWQFVHAVHYIDPAQSLRWWRIDFGFFGSPSRDLDVGRVMIDAAYVSPRALDIQHTLELADSSILARSQAGGLFPVKPGEQWREIEVTLSALTQQQALGELLAIRRKVGAAKEVFAWIEPGNSSWVVEQGILGLVTEIDTQVTLIGERYRARLRIAEMLPNAGIGTA